MPILKKLVVLADSVATFTGKSVAWLTLAMMIITCLIVILRYGFQISSVAMEESVIYLHALVFMLGAAYTFKEDEHVRVDVFYREFSAFKKAWVNFLGGLFFLLPVTLFTFYISLDYIFASWEVLETSSQSGGLPFIYLLKTLIPIMMISLIIQGIADIIRNLGFILGDKNPILPEHHGSTGI